MVAQLAVPLAAMQMVPSMAILAVSVVMTPVGPAAENLEVLAAVAVWPESSKPNLVWPLKGASTHAYPLGV